MKSIVMLRTVTLAASIAGILSIGEAQSQPPAGFLAPTPTCTVLSSAGVLSSNSKCATQTYSVRVPGTSNPWDQVKNPTMLYSADAFPPVVIPLYQFGAGAAVAGNYLTLTCVGGLTNAGDLPDTGCDGVKGIFPPNNAQWQPACGYYYPAKYQDRSTYPTYVFQVIAVFATNAGVVVGKPFPISSASTSVPIPKGATVLQLGMNDCYNSDNTSDPLYVSISYVTGQ